VQLVIHVLFYRKKKYRITLQLVVAQHGVEGAPNSLSKKTYCRLKNRGPLS